MLAFSNYCIMNPADYCRLAGIKVRWSRRNRQARKNLKRALRQAGVLTEGA